VEDGDSRWEAFMRKTGLSETKRAKKKKKKKEKKRGARYTTRVNTKKLYRVTSSQKIGQENNPKREVMEKKLRLSGHQKRKKKNNVVKGQCVPRCLNPTDVSCVAFEKKKKKKNKKKKKKKKKTGEAK